MNNGYQKYNGCRADKEGGKFFNTFFYPELQSKHIHPLAYNGKRLCDVAVSKHFTFNLTLMFNQGTTRQLCTSPAIAQNTCYKPFLI